MVVFGVIIVGLGAFAAYKALNPAEKETDYSDDNKNNGNDTENKDDEGNNNNTGNNNNITAIESRIFANIPILEGFILYRGFENKGQNVLSSANNRLELIIIL